MAVGNAVWLRAKFMFAWFCRNLNVSCLRISPPNLKLWAPFVHNNPSLAV